MPSSSEPHEETRIPLPPYPYLRICVERSRSAQTAGSLSAFGAPPVAKALGFPGELVGAEKGVGEDCVQGKRTLLQSPTGSRSVAGAETVKACEHLFSMINAQHGQYAS